MVGHIRMLNMFCPVTQPELWTICKTEDEYFRILKERQKKGGDYEPLIIEETEEQKQIPGSLNP
jgi:hypothetical protein